MDLGHCYTPLVYYFGYGGKKTRPTILLLLVILLLSSISFGLAFAACFFFRSSHLFCFYQADDPLQITQSDGTGEKVNKPPCSSMSNNTICCDRTAYRTDVCYMMGDVRSHSASNSILLLSSTNSSFVKMEEKIRPYPRKWETSIMSRIDELRLLRTKSGDTDLHCDVSHDATAIVFSTGGYTGNVYHDFNDGLIPLYITSQHLNQKVVFVILQYHDWWITKYGDVLSRLSDYPPIDYSKDRRTHCFPRSVVGLRIHGELAVDPARTEKNETIGDFRRLLEEAFGPRIRGLELEEDADDDRPKLVILSRNGSRAIENEAGLVEVVREVGFRVEVLKPDRTSELAKLYGRLNSSDAVVGVHGAALTHLLFMRPGSAFVQIVPLGTEWAAERCFGEPAAKMGLWYMAYQILPTESSLYREYKKSDDPVLKDPKSVAKKGWNVTKSVYLDKQTVMLDLVRFRKHLVLAYQYLEWKKRSSI